MLLRQSVSQPVSRRKSHSVSRVGLGADQRDSGSSRADFGRFVRGAPTQQGERAGEQSRKPNSSKHRSNLRMEALQAYPYTISTEKTTAFDDTHLVPG